MPRQEGESPVVCRLHCDPAVGACAVLLGMGWAWQMDHYTGARASSGSEDRRNLNAIISQAVDAMNPVRKVVAHAAR